jgi:hypothetical protein
MKEIKGVYKGRVRSRAVNNGNWKTERFDVSNKLLNMELLALLLQGNRGLCILIRLK